MTSTRNRILALVLLGAPLGLNAQSMPLIWQHLSPRPTERRSLASPLLDSPTSFVRLTSDTANDRGHGHAIAGAIVGVALGGIVAYAYTNAHAPHCVIVPLDGSCRQLEPDRSRLAIGVAITVGALVGGIVGDLADHRVVASGSRPAP